MKQQPIFLRHHHYNSTSILHVRRNRDKYAYVGVFHTSYIYIIPVVLILFSESTYTKKNLKVKNDLMHINIIIYLDVSQWKTPNDYKKSVDASTAIMTMMKEKSCSCFTHSLIVLVARSSWPFMCATRALFLLAFSLTTRGWSMVMVK
jgi:hypothetical protein